MISFWHRLYRSRMPLNLLQPMNFGNSFYETSYQQPCSSVGALNMVNVEYIKSEENIDYLEQLCGFIENMNINPLWFDSESDKNKLKLLQVFQLAITYSKNLSQSYKAEIAGWQSKNQNQAQENEEKIKNIKENKEKVRRMKYEYKKRKLAHLQRVYEMERLMERQQEEESEWSVDERPPYPHPQFYPNEYYQPQHAYYQQPYPPTHMFPHPPNDNHSLPQAHQYPKMPNQHNQQREHSPQPQRQYPPQPHSHNAVQQNPNYQQPQASNPNQGPAVPLHEQLAAALLPRPAGQAGPRPEQIVNTRSMNKQLRTSQTQNRLGQTKNTVGINSKKVNKSLLVEEENEPQYRDMDHSQILNSKKINEIKQDQKTPSLKLQKDHEIQRQISIEMQKQKSGQLKRQRELQSQRQYQAKKPKPNPSITDNAEQDDFDQIGNLTAQSKKSFTKKEKQSGEQLSKRSNDSIQQGQFDSIAQVRLGNKSKIETNALQSRITPRNSTRPSKPNVSKPISPIPSQVEPSSDQMELPAFSHNSKFSSNQTSENNKLFQKKPQRNSQNLGRKAQKQPGQEDEDFFNQISLHPNSKISNKDRKEKPSSAEEFSIGQSVHHQQVRGESGSSAERMYAHGQPPPARKPKKNEEPSLLRVSEANSQVLNQSKNKMLQSATVNMNADIGASQKNEDYANIYTSNVRGEIQEYSNNSEKLYHEKRPQRANNKAENEEERLSSVRTPPKLQKEPMKAVKQEQQNYEHEGFQEQFNLLQQSYVPNSKQGKPKIEEPSQPLRSAVDIVVPSAQSIQATSKFYKLKGEEFVVSRNRNETKIERSRGVEERSRGMEERGRGMEESSDPFDDFIDFMPANSIIAKPSARFQPGKKPIYNEPRSLKDVSSDNGKGSSNNISINLISADNEKRKLLTKQQQKHTQRQRQEQAVPDILRQSNLPIGDMMLSRVLDGNISNNTLNYRNEQPEKPKNEIAQKSQDEADIMDSSLQMDLENSVKIQKKQKPAGLNTHSQNIVALVKKSQLVNPLPLRADKFDPLPLKADKFDNRLIGNVLADVCKLRSDTQQLQDLEKAKHRLQVQVKKMREKREQRSKVLDELIKRENIVIKQESKQPNKQEKPRNSSGFNNGSLNYSQSYLDQKHQAAPKRELKLGKNDIADSIVFNNPYTPGADELKPQQPIKQEKKSPRAANPFLLGNNKTLGSREQQNLLKNAGEGISRYNKDDPIEREMLKVITLQSKLKDQNEDEW